MFIYLSTSYFGFISAEHVISSLEIGVNKTISFLPLWQVCTYLHFLGKETVVIKVLKRLFKNSTKVVGAIET